MGIIVSSVYDCADAFSKLLDIEYEIVLGRKMQNVTLRVEFRKTDLFHLLGFQYLLDRPELNHDREKVFYDLRKRKLSDKHIEKSHHYKKIRERVNYLPLLESIFDDNNTVFRYNENLNNFSLIKAAYLMKNEVQFKNVFTFLSASESGKYFCRSFFPQERIDYSIGQTSWTLLYKKKIYRKTGTEVILYDRKKTCSCCFCI